MVNASLFPIEKSYLRNNFPIALSVIGGKLMVIVGFPTGTWKNICAQELLMKHELSV